MAVYGISKYGADFYGYDLPPAYRVDPFVATSINYSSVLVSWTRPAGNISGYRLVKNRFGFPVDQDDGQILIDTPSYPGQQFIDSTVVPGTYQYYGFFVLLQNTGPTAQESIWVRSGWTACLAINNYSSGLQIHSLMPAFYHLQESDIQLQIVDDFPSEILDFFCTVLGWGIDYLKTQYDTYLHVNDPWKISVKDLYNLATQLGININPDIHPYTLRKAVFFNAVVTQQRGTTSGINQELEALTGYAADLTLAPNFMLENDQSNFTDPVFLQWSPNIAYQLNEFVQFGNFNYQSRTSTGNINHPPTGANTSNTWWNPVAGVDFASFISNGVTGHLNTWEALMLNSSTGQSTGMSEKVGIVDPLNSARNTANGLDFQNTGSTGTMLVRSISRVGTDITTNGPLFPPNKDQAVSDGIPVPFVTNTLEWNGTSWLPTVRYGTNSIVTVNNVPYMALRASTNVQPPVTSRLSANNEWAPVSPEPRIRICISGYFQAATSGITVTPFCEWYDSSGNFLTRVTARNSSPGINVLPSGLAYDSFTFPASASINNRTTDDGGFTWNVRVGGLSSSPFSDGCTYPTSSTQRSYATIPSGVSDGQVGATFVSNPSSSTVTGIIMRWQDDNNYLLATMSTLFLKQNGTYTALGSYSTAANPGDRVIVQLSGSSITVLVNNVQVLQATSSFNVTGTTHGLINDIISSIGPGGNVSVTNPGPQTGTVGIST